MEVLGKRTWRVWEERKAAYEPVTTLSSPHLDRSGFRAPGKMLRLRLVLLGIGCWTQAKSSRYRAGQGIPRSAQ